MPTHDDRVLVVGTTRDYVESIFSAYPGRALFLTDPREYESNDPSRLPDTDELVSPLIEPVAVFGKLVRYVTTRGIRLRGVACFDCESLLLACELARRFSLPFPSRRAILNCRDKFASKLLFRAAGVACPRVARAASAIEAIRFVDELGGPAVLKPATLSGSELTFKCDDPAETASAFGEIRSGLRARRFDSILDRDRMIDGDTVLCEEYIDGDEYSCDFIHDGGTVHVIRTAGKHLLAGGPTGTVMAYEVPAPVSDTHKASPPDSAANAPGILSSVTLREAIHALDLDRSMGMVDFIVRDGVPYLLEITPRPGGDCLPPLIRHGSGFDMLSAHLDFAEGCMPSIQETSNWLHLVGLRIHADRKGLFERIVLDDVGLEQEIIEIAWHHRSGDSIVLPPSDYRSWLLGHIIFRPVPGKPVVDQITQVRDAVKIVMQGDRALDPIADSLRRIAEGMA